MSRKRLLEYGPAVFLEVLMFSHGAKCLMAGVCYRPLGPSGMNSATKYYWNGFVMVENPLLCKPDGTAK